MLKGKEFGNAIGKAIQLMLESGHAKSKAEIARHFAMKPPSLADWVKKGSVSKDKIPDLYRYFSPVADCFHWGMTPDEWPAGLSAAPPRAGATHLLAHTKPGPGYVLNAATERHIPFQRPQKAQRTIDEERVAEIASKLDDTGLGMLLKSAEDILEARQNAILKNAV